MPTPLDSTVVADMHGDAGTVVVLGTGGTIAGTARNALDNVDYVAAEWTVQALVDAVPALAALTALRLEAEQLSQIDSKDMGHTTWQALARCVAAHLARARVMGVVVTHGTDTLEETAYFLARMLAPTKPVVLTAAMRPATSLQADGPQNPLDAITVACVPGAHGVLAVMAGNVYASPDLQKLHSYRIDAFSAGDAGLLGRIEEGVFRRFRSWPVGPALGLAQVLTVPADRWPRVEIVQNHAGSDGRIVDALLAQGLDGLVLAGTGNGTLGAGLEAAARRAEESGVDVLRTSRCAFGGIVGARGAGLPQAGTLTPVQARIELMLQRLQQR